VSSGWRGGRIFSNLGTPRHPRSLTRLTVTLVLSIGLCACTSERHSEIGTEAPPNLGLVIPPASGWATVKPVGTKFGNGWLVLQHVGSSRLRIDSVQVEQNGEGLRYLGAKLAGNDRTVGFHQETASWPPKEPALGDVRDAVGAELKPGERARTWGYELLLGFEVVKPGRSTMRSVTLQVTDLETDETRTIRATSTMAICTPPTRPEQCEGEYG
jgi:hypothetical protein